MASMVEKFPVPGLDHVTLNNVVQFDQDGTNDNISLCKSGAPGDWQDHFEVRRGAHHYMINFASMHSIVNFQSMPDSLIPRQFILPSCKCASTA